APKPPRDGLGAADTRFCATSACYNYGYFYASAWATRFSLCATDCNRAGGSLQKEEEGRGDPDAAGPEGSAQRCRRRYAAARLPRDAAFGERTALAAGPRRAESPLSADRLGERRQGASVRSRQRRRAPCARHRQRILHLQEPAAPRTLGR